MIVFYYGWISATMCMNLAYIYANNINEFCFHSHVLSICHEIYGKWGEFNKSLLENYKYYTILIKFS